MINITTELNDIKNIKSNNNYINKLISYIISIIDDIDIINIDDNLLTLLKEIKNYILSYEQLPYYKQLFSKDKTTHYINELSRYKSFNKYIMVNEDIKTNIIFLIELYNNCITYSNTSPDYITSLNKQIDENLNNITIVNNKDEILIIDLLYKLNAIFFNAITKQHIILIKYLLDKDIIDLNYVDQTTGLSILTYCIEHRYNTIIDEILKYNTLSCDVFDSHNVCDINKPIKYVSNNNELGTLIFENMTPLFYAIMKQNNTIIYTLLKLNVDCDVICLLNGEELNVLMFSILYNNMTMFKYFVENKQYYKYINNYSKTILMFALNNINMFNTILFDYNDIEYIINKSDNNSRNILHYICLHGNIKLLHSLCLCKVNINSLMLDIDINGNHPLMYAIQNEYINIIEYLIPYIPSTVYYINNNKGENIMSLAEYNPYIYSLLNSF